MSAFIDASDLFLFIASVGIVAVTLVIIVVGYQTAKLLEEARTLIHTLTTEVTVFSRGRKELFYRAQFATTWLSSFIRILLKRS